MTGCHPRRPRLTLSARCSVKAEAQQEATDALERRLQDQEAALAELSKERDGGVEAISDLTQRIGSLQESFSRALSVTAGAVGMLESEMARRKVEARRLEMERTSAKLDRERLQDLLVTLQAEVTEVVGAARVFLREEEEEFTRERLRSDREREREASMAREASASRTLFSSNTTQLREMLRALRDASGRHMDRKRSSKIQKKGGKTKGQGRNSHLARESNSMLPGHEHMWGELSSGLRQARVGGAAAVFGGGKILFAGGTDGVKVRADCEVFDCVSLSWQRASPMLTPRVSHQLVEVATSTPLHSTDRGHHLCVADSHSPGLP